MAIASEGALPHGEGNLLHLDLVCGAALGRGGGDKEIALQRPPPIWRGLNFGNNVYMYK